MKGWRLEKKNKFKKLRRGEETSKNEAQRTTSSAHRHSIMTHRHFKSNVTVVNDANFHLNFDTSNNDSDVDMFD